MDIIFNCPHCEQEIAVDSTASGSTTQCPTCNQTIVIPDSEEGVPRVAVEERAVVPSGHPVNPIASSAAAKVEMHLKVPTHHHTESLITKALPPLEAAAKDTEKRIRVKTIRHTDCIEVGHDRFDEIVTNFLGKVGQENIISLSTLSYTYLDIGSQKLLTDYGLLVVYKG
jgi:hypothetical protein